MRRYVQTTFGEVELHLFHRRERALRLARRLGASASFAESGREWVDAIRKSGNEATHEIVLASEDDAKQLLDFAEMLLRIVYEFPMKIHRS